jgi:hypothetical protein
VVPFVSFAFFVLFCGSKKGRKAAKIMLAIPVMRVLKKGLRSKQKNN